MKSGFAIARLSALATILLLPAPHTAKAQENSAKRLASIVSVAVEEYKKAVDASGKLISDDEYTETTGFLTDAQSIAHRLKGYNAPLAQAVLDTLVAAVAAKKSPADVTLLEARFKGALGVSGAMDLPSQPLDTARGHGLFTTNCASCHGERGMGDGVAAKGLNVEVPAIGARLKTPDMSPTLAYNVVSVGVRNTPMPSFSSLPPQDRWDIVNYVYALRQEKMSLPAADATAAPGSAAAREVMALLDSAMEFARTGKKSEAGDRAFDAYIAFEPLETPARAKQPGLVSAMERHFAEFKAAVRKNDMTAAQGARDAIALDLPRVVELTRPTAGGWGAFFQSLLIIVREGFEAILVIGAVVAFLLKMGHRERLRSIWIGVVFGVLASLATAIVLATVFSHLPASREIVEGVTMLIAVAVLFSVSYWLISRVEAAKWQKFIREKVGVALEQGGGKALVLVAFLAVYREGAETALFYQALFNEGTGLFIPLVLGILAGAAILVLIFTLFYRYGVKIPMRPFFTITSVLLYYMAFVFMGKGMRELQEGNVIPITVMRGLPNIPSMGIFPSIETIAAQGLLVVLLAFAVLKTFVLKPRASERG
ncbi:MAG TPA: cytochrome c/FTR1 family iron permease [Gemmatimonadaceae bacterium]|nr:cytochrome c/FTR1 family iron permease [Gemmatimonadaceae bacterium]